jgi:cytochrome c556
MKIQRGEPRRKAGRFARRRRGCLRGCHRAEESVSELHRRKVPSEHADHESAKAQLTRAREQLAITVTFWRDKKKSDALKLLKDALDSTDDLDAALSAESVEPSVIRGTSQRLAAACQACHAVYRDQDPATKTYRVKRDAIR